jgi:RNase P/RNase MRP subunit p29
MLKKMSLWSLYAAFLGLLLAGAAYRTSVKLAESGQEQHRGNTSRNQPGSEAIIRQVDQHNHDRVGLEGNVVGISKQSLSIQLANGQVLEISRRAWRYAQHVGFIAQSGDLLRLEGFYENGNFEVTRMTNLHNAQSVILRDENDHPLWSGNQ